MKINKFAYHITVFVCAVVLIIAGCSKEKPKRSSSSLPKKLAFLEGQQFVVSGFTTSVSSKPESLLRKDKGRRKNYSLSKTAFSAKYHVISQRKDGQFGLITLLDYKQVPIQINGKRSTYNELAMQAKAQATFPFNINGLNNSFHDFAMILIWSPNNHSLDKKYRFSTDLSFINPQRATLVSNNSKPPKINYNAVGTRLKPKELPVDGIVVNKKSNKLDYWLKEEVTPNKKVRFFVHMANKDSAPRTFALMAFMDFKQIPVKLGGPLVIYGKNKPDEVLIIPAEFKAPVKKGVHELLFLWAANPFSRLPESGQIGGQHFDDRIEPSVRVPIVVK